MAATQTGKINEVLKPETGFIKDLISEGRGKGFITLDDINNHLGDDPPSAEQLEQIFNIFAEMDIDVVDSSKKVSIDQRGVSPEMEFDMSDELNLEPSIDNSTDDPVRMYLREMGSIELLTRNGEIEVAQKIEEGQIELIEIFTQSHLIQKQLIELNKRLKSQKIRARHIVSGLDDDDNVIEDEDEATQKLIDLLDKHQKHYDKTSRIQTRLHRSRNKKKDTEEIILNTKVYQDIVRSITLIPGRLN